MNTQQIMAKSIGCEPRQVEKAVYKGTDCGAWIVFHPSSIKVGSIVEGYDAEFDITVDHKGNDDDFVGGVWSALEDMVNDFLAEAE